MYDSLVSYGFLNFRNSCCDIQSSFALCVSVFFGVWSLLVLAEGVWAKEPMWRYFMGFLMGFFLAGILSWNNALGFAINLFLFSALSICAIFDILEMMVPQACSVLPCLFFIGLSAIGATTNDFATTTLGVLFISTLMLSVNFIIKKAYNKTGIGMGDLQIFATVVSVLGLEKALMVIQISSVLGLLFMGMHQMLSHKPVLSLERFAFAPYILISTFITQLFYLARQI